MKNEIPCHKCHVSPKIPCHIINNCDEIAYESPKKDEHEKYFQSEKKDLPKKSKKK